MSKGESANLVLELDPFPDSEGDPSMMVRGPIVAVWVTPCAPENEKVAKQNAPATYCPQISHGKPPPRTRFEDLRFT